MNRHCESRIMAFALLAINSDEAIRSLLSMNVISSIQVAALPIQLAVTINPDCFIAIQSLISYDPLAIRNDVTYSNPSKK